MADKQIKIVLTGGPGAGKTVVAQAAVERLHGAVTLVPEAATHVYSKLRTRWDRIDADQRRDVQRQIYQWQLEQESKVAASAARILLLDRGTVDGAAYWPDGAEAYWPAMNTTLAGELARYDLVIFLETAATLGLYDGEASNDVRFEDAAGAIESGKQLLRMWGAHPNIKHVGAFENIERKIAMVVGMVRAAMESRG